jgi:hypothetical protein
MALIARLELIFLNLRVYSSFCDIFSDISTLLQSIEKVIVFVLPEFISIESFSLFNAEIENGMFNMNMSKNFIKTDI